MPQLQINQGPQDALLFDNTRSYFTNVGYKTTSNFQYEYRDIDPQNQGGFGSTLHFVIPKAADLLGPVDLLVDVNPASGGCDATGTGITGYAAWVDTLGFAMIEKINFEIGSNPIEEITGEQLNIINEMMRDKSARLGFNTIMRTGRVPVADLSNTATAGELGGSQSAPTGRYNRIIGYDNATTVKFPTARKFIIPLGLFFTKHPSAYFPLAAIAGCNDVRITVKLRTIENLIQVSSETGTPAVSKPTWTNGALDTSSIRLRCHYVNTTGPEAGAIMNKEHVRLMKLWTNQNFNKTISTGERQVWKVDLSFLHPVCFLIITLRRTEEIDNSSLTAEATTGAVAGKGYFNYHGGEEAPNRDSNDASPAWLKLNNMKLSLNGQDRHPSLSTAGLDMNYCQHRLMPMLFSESGDMHNHCRFVEGSDGSGLAHLASLGDKKNIFFYPFCLNPEGANPSGSVNFSKVSHAKLELDLSAYNCTNEEFRLDVYAIYYNWLQIKDGRALLSFA